MGPPRPARGETKASPSPSPSPRPRTKKSQSQSQSPLGRPEQAGPTGPTEAPRPHSPLLLQTLTGPLADVQRARASRVPREGEESSSEHQFDFMMPGGARAQHRTHTQARARARAHTSTSTISHEHEHISQSKKQRGSDCGYAIKNY